MENTHGWRIREKMEVYRAKWEDWQATSVGFFQQGTLAGRGLPHGIEWDIPSCQGLCIDVDNPS